jgi:histidinol-phosphate phosphatase family protein
MINKYIKSDQLSRPTQAVILAGGRGTRLRPLTDTRPKPMIEFHRKPFLEYLIEMVRDQGFQRFLILLGYLPDVIQDYFGDGSRWGVEIEYAVSAPEDDTGRRLKLAEPRIDPVFLLMYSDNYWPMPFDEMWQKFVSSGTSALVTVYRNNDQYTRDNLRVDEVGYIETYDKSRTAPNLHGVDIGFMILKRPVLNLLPNGNVSFENTVYPQLVAQRQLQAYITEHRYYSVGTHERLPLTKEFLAHRPAVLLDRDGVLNRKMPRAQYVCSWADWEWLPGAREALRLFKDAGYRVIVISNQAGIARGAMTEAILLDIHERMKQEVREASGEINAIYYCPHDWDEGCECRKPRPGMFFQAQRDLSLDLSRTYFIGDDERDVQAADAAGCPWALVSEDVSLLDITHGLLNNKLES